MPNSLRTPVNTSLKYSIRLWVVPILASVLKFVGLNWVSIGRRLGRETTIAQNQMLVRTDKRKGTESKRSESSQNIIILSMISGHTFSINHEILFAHLLRSRGHKITFIVCDQELHVCETKKYGKEGRWSELCGKCYSYGQKLLNSAEFDAIPISLFNQEVDINDGVLERFSHIIEASLLKHYQVGELTPDLPELSQRRQMVEKSVRISAKVGEGIAALKPDKVIMSHGIYATWGPQREILCKAGIPVVTYSETKKKQTLKFNWNYSADWWDVQSAWDLDKDKPLTSIQEAKIDTYLDSRINHSQDVMVYNFGEQQSKMDTYKRLGLNPERLTYSLFTNVLWDASSAQREIVFSSPIEWARETIQWFGQHPEKQLIVKVHPAEVVIGTNQSFVDIIQKQIEYMPPNVRIIPPQEKINSWSVCDITDLGLVHTTTVGMELPILGIPAVVVSKTHFRGKGFTVDPNSKTEYFKYLEEFDINRVDRIDLKTCSKRYAYILFERYQLPFDFTFTNKHYSNVCALKMGSLTDMSCDPIVQFIAECIENNQPFVLPD